MPTRSSRFLSGLFFGYGTIGVNIIYTICSVPLALHYLGKEEFGLWALAQQVSGYLMLLDLGVSSALSRFLADHKDDVNGGKYGSLLLTGGLVFLVQGTLIAAAGIVLSLFAPALFSIPSHLTSSFSNLLILLTTLSGISVAVRSIGAPLWAFQRLDLVNAISSLTLLLGLGVLWLGFHSNWGIYSLALVPIPGLILGSVVVAIIGLKKGYYPAFGKWGRPQWPLFKEIFNFGKDVLLMSLGSQLVNASQIMLISRLLGLDAAATFAVAIKFATMGQQFVQKLLESSAPGLAEMFVRGDMTGFVRRFWDIVALTAASSAIVAAVLAAVNRDAVFVWTQGAIIWSASGDWLLAMLLCLTALSRCFIGLFGLTRNLSPVRFIYLMEGIVFIAMAFFLAQTWGLNGILLSSVIAQFLVTSVSGLWAAKAVLGNLRPALGLYAKPFLIVTSAWICGFFAFGTSHTLIQVILIASSIGIAAVLLSSIFLVPSSIKTDLRNKFLQPLRKK